MTRIEEITAELATLARQCDQLIAKGPDVVRLENYIEETKAIREKQAQLVKEAADLLSPYCLTKNTFRPE